MNNKFNVFLSVAVLVIATLGFLGYKGLSQELSLKVGANPGTDFYNPLSFLGGVTDGYSRSTTTTGTAVTLSASDLVNRDGGAYGVVVVSPNIGDTTITFPASSTLKHFLPKVGSSARQCWVNATTSAGIDLIFAEGTGVILQKATSTAGGIGLPNITPNSVGCFNFVRGSTTPSQFDIYGLFTEYKDVN